ncbi:hypothetical protein CATMIT_01684, partial [Catenibacterium mitsuokai DSM 15897]
MVRLHSVSLLRDDPVAGVLRNGLVFVVAHPGHVRRRVSDAPSGRGVFRAVGRPLRPPLDDARVDRLDDDGDLADGAAADPGRHRPLGPG